MKKTIFLILLLSLISCVSLFVISCGQHRHKLIEISENPASCEENGNIKYFHCSTCNKCFLDEFGKIEIDLEDTIIQAGHLYGDWQIFKSPTCAEEGVEYKECERCKAKITRSIPKTTTHLFGEWHCIKPATCTTEGLSQRTCNICGKTESKTLSTTSHNISNEFFYDERSHWKECLSCHQKFLSSGHIFDNEENKKGIIIHTCSTCSFQKEELPTVLDAYGSGTITNPYLIYTADQYFDLFNCWGDNKYNNSGNLNVKLMRDITLTTIPTALSGTTCAYSNVFDGNNKTITTPFINIFPYLNGEIKNLTISVYGNSLGITKSGYLITRILALGKISNITLKGNENFVSNYTGFTENNFGIIENCKNYLSANIQKLCDSGIAGTNYGKIMNTENYANLCITKDSAVKCINGIVGENHGNLSNCTNYGNLESLSTNNSTCKSNGIAGKLFKGSNISNCKNYGTLSIQNSGGLFGEISGLQTTSEESARTSIVIKNCCFLKNETTNKNLSWLFSKMGSETETDTFSDENIKKYFPNIDIPTTVAEVI